MTTTLPQKDTKPPEKQSVIIKSDKMREGKISTKHQKKPQMTLKMAKLHEMDKKGLQKEKKRPVNDKK